RTAGPGSHGSEPAEVTGKGEVHSHPTGPVLASGEGTLDLSDCAGLKPRAERATEVGSSVPDGKELATDDGQAISTPPPDDPAAAPTGLKADGQAPPAPRERPLPRVEGYEILSELDRGGMGVVYRAREVLLNRPCVLKMILAGAHADAVSVVRFLAEAEA